MEFFHATMKQVYEPDVLVCGLGPAGISAAVAAARMGASVLGIEKCGFAGGNITNANVIGVCGATDMFTGRLVAGGITKELLGMSGFLRDPVDYDKMTPLSEIDMETALLYPHVAKADNLTHPNFVSMIYDAEAFKLAADKILTEAGVRILYHSFVCDVETNGDRIHRVIVANKDGLSEIRAKTIIDCTGDADVAAWAGVPYDIRPEFMQSGTTMFVCGNVKYDDYAELKVRCIETFVQAQKDGHHLKMFGPAVGRLRKGVINFNMTRIPYNQTVASEYTQAEIDARIENKKAFDILKSYMPEFKDAYMLYSGPQLGCRETRHIHGLYTLLAKDIVDRVPCEDSIGLAGCPIDFHDPSKMGAKCGGVMEYVSAYPIPYRTLVPQKINNLLVAGRCHSAEQLAAASTRVAPTCSVMGEAAGVAAAMTVRDHCEPATVSVTALQDRLRQTGGILEPDRSEKE